MLTKAAKRIQRLGRGKLGFIRAVVAVAGLPGLLLLAPTPAHATSTNPYTGTGYDASYPQCSATGYPSGFAIIGMGGGRPFTTNSCDTQQWSIATNSTTDAAPSLYFNTGYSGAYGRDITSACKSAASVSGNVPSPPPNTSKRQASVYTQAWEIGCSEADFAYQNEPGTPAMWWADVEIGNSWSTDTNDNDFTLDGLAYEMGQLATTTHDGGGFYSPPSSWASIAGAGFKTTPLATADWQPTTSCPSTGTAGFSGSPVWVIQNGNTVVNGVTFDGDASCG